MINDHDGSWCWRCLARRSKTSWKRRMEMSLRVNERARRALHRELGQS